MPSPLPSPQRVWNGTRFVKAQTPYFSPQSVASPQAHRGAPIYYERLTTWRGPPGYGQHHVYDDAPFTLWNDQTRDFRKPTRSETQWIMDRFLATGMTIRFPDIIVETASPPSPVPLTVAGVAVTFVAPPPPPPVSFGSHTHILVPRSMLDPGPIRMTTGYVGPRIADPLDFKLPRWACPEDEQIEAVVNAVMSCCNARAISFLCPWIVVEIRVDGRVYRPHSLPAYFAGFSAIYHHQQTSVFEGKGNSSRERLVSPSGDVYVGDSIIIQYD